MEEKTLVEMIFGALNLNQWLGFLFFILMGLALSKLILLQKRNKMSSNTPRKFNWFFWWNDNKIMLGIFIIVIFLTMRFYVKLYQEPMNEFNALAFGTVVDLIIAKLIEGKGFIAKNREKFKLTNPDK